MDELMTIELQDATFCLILKDVIRDFPICFPFLDEHEDPQRKGDPKIDIAVSTYRKVFCKNSRFGGLRPFRRIQIFQIYYQFLLNKGSEYVNSSEAWHDALLTESLREAKFILDVITPSLREKFILLMIGAGISLCDMYILVDKILRLQEIVIVMATGSIRLPGTPELERMIAERNALLKANNLYSDEEEADSGLLLE